MNEETKFCNTCQKNTLHKYVVEYNFGDPALGVKDERRICTEQHISVGNLEKLQDRVEQDLALEKKLSKWR